MGRNPEIRYINTYVSGSAAYQLEPGLPQQKKQVKLPRPRREEKKVIRLDPVAIMGIIVAVVLLVLLVAGFARLEAAQAEARTLNAYVSALQEQNRKLQDTYASGYDLEEIREIALAMGMVPADELRHIQTELVIPPQPEEPDAWEALCTFLTGLFA